MPTIVVRADQGGEIGPATLSERVITANLRDKHYTAQLIERLTWATLDAENLQQTSNPADTNPFAGQRQPVFTADEPDGLDPHSHDAYVLDNDGGRELDSLYRPGAAQPATPPS